MRLVFIVNRLSDVDPRQTTAMLIETGIARGHELFAVEADEVSLGPDDEVLLPSRPVRPGHRNQIGHRLTGRPGGQLRLSSGDAVVVRTNPARDSRAGPHVVLLDLLRHLKERGVAVFNDPSGLDRAWSKLYLTSIPRQFRPRTLVSRDPIAIRRFVEETEGPTVLKPLVGTRGTNVFLMDSASRTNLAQITDVLVRHGYAMVQDYVPEASEGDTRVMLLGGRPLSVGGAVAAVRRVPSGCDFRSNVHVGGRPKPAEFTNDIQHMVRAVGPGLASDGLLLVGLDVIGGLVIEINAFSPGCLCDANPFYGVDFTVPIVERFEEMASV